MDFKTLPETMKQTISKDWSTDIGVPDGFVLVRLQEGTPCIVPEYLVPATHQAFDRYRKCLELDVRNELGGVRVLILECRRRMP